MQLLCVFARARHAAPKRKDRYCARRSICTRRRCTPANPRKLARAPALTRFSPSGYAERPLFSRSRVGFSAETARLITRTLGTHSYRDREQCSLARQISNGKPRDAITSGSRYIVDALFFASHTAIASIDTSRWRARAALRRAVSFGPASIDSLQLLRDSHCCRARKRIG